MTSVTNKSRATLPLVVGGTPSAPKVENLAPGQTRNVDLKKDDPRLVGLAHVGQIKINAEAAPRKTAEKSVLSGD